MIAPPEHAARRTEKSATMRRWSHIATHAAAAAAFIFLLQRFALGATTESSLLWALTFGVCAAGLAYMQTNR